MIEKGGDPYNFNGVYRVSVPKFTKKNLKITTCNLNTRIQDGQTSLNRFKIDSEKMDLPQVLVGVAYIGQT